MISSDFGCRIFDPPSQFVRRDVRDSCKAVCPEVTLFRLNDSRYAAGKFRVDEIHQIEIAAREQRDPACPCKPHVIATSSHGPNRNIEAAVRERIFLIKGSVPPYQVSASS